MPFQVRFFGGPADGFEAELDTKPGDETTLDRLLWNPSGDEVWIVYVYRCLRVTSGGVREYYLADEQAAERKFGAGLATLN